MKKFIIPFILITGLSAQMGITVVAGLNLSTIKFNESEFEDLFDITSQIGLAIGAEKMLGPVNVGAAFVQRGAKTSVDFFGETFEGTRTDNYLALHGLYPYSVMDALSVFGGLQLGIGLGGTSEFDDESEDIKSGDMALDYGLLLGADYTFMPNIGVRLSYYLGLADVDASEIATSDTNFKNRSIGINLFYKL